PLSKDGPPPAPISSEEREPHPRPHVSTSVAFQHLFPGSPNGAVVYPDWLEIEFSTTSYSRRFFALTTGFGVQRPNLREEECS
ncbi:hypothetical protein AVEN_161224-1, partial [Araneus ventricosus]